MDLGEHAPQLLEAARIISGQSLWSYEYGIKDINAAADRIRASVSSLAQLMTKTGQIGGYSAPDVIVASETGQRPWTAFWWGFSACGIFVIVVLALWAYAHIHR